MIGRANAVGGGAACNIRVGSSSLRCTVYYTDMSGTRVEASTADSSFGGQVPRYSTVELRSPSSIDPYIYPADNAVITSRLTEATRENHCFILVKGDCHIE